MQRKVDNSTFHSNIPLAADITLGVVYSIFGICSLCGNSMLLYVSYKRKHLLKPAEFFIINLAVSDLGMTLIYPLAVTSSFQHRWLYGRTVCVMYAFSGVLFGICSLTTLTLLSTVCCLKVSYPLYGNRFGCEHSCVLIAFAWGYALVFACSPLAHLGQYGPEPYGTACCIDWTWSNRDPIARSYTTALFVCCYLLPCTIIVLSYTQILLTVRGSRRAVEQHVAVRTGNIQNIIMKLSIAVCIGFFTAWSPYAFISVWAAYGNVEEIPPLAFALPAMLSKSSTIYNPLIYLLLKPNFRKLVCTDVSSMLQRCRHNCLARCVPCSAPNLRQLSLKPQRKRDCHCQCEWCNDPFERFKMYPRRCPVTISTVQFSMQDNPNPELEFQSRARTRQEEEWGTRVSSVTAKNSVCVIVKEKKSFESECLEITGETGTQNSQTPRKEFK